MTNTQLNRLLRLIKRTNNPLVVLDQTTDNANVLLSLDRYEDLLGPEGMESWDPSPSNSPSLDWNGFEDDDQHEWLEDEIESAEPPFAPPEEFAPASTTHEKENAAPETAASEEAVTPNIKTSAALSPEEDLSDVPHEEEEEKFYLEPVE